MISFRKDGVHFGHRTVAVIINENRVLLHHIEGRDFCALPGGTVEMHEDSRQALIREMQEELGLDVHVGRLLWVVENFFEETGMLHRGVELFYLVSLPVDAPLLKASVPLHVQDGDAHLILKWLPLDALDEITLYPVFLKTGLRNLPETTKHIVVHQ